MRTTELACLVWALAMGAMGCGSDAEPEPTSAPEPVPAHFDPDVPYEPALAPSDLSPEITNPLYPLPVGASWVFEAETSDGLERIEISVEAETQIVWGAEARVVRDTAYVDGEVVEDTWDWFAQDTDGNVWYLGEDTAEYEDGELTSREGSWEAGVDGALPGVVMLAKPKLGDTYRQEYYAGEAEDYAEIVALSESVSVPAGDYTDCLKTHDLSAIDPELDEFKYYCAGIGTVLIEEGDVREELITSAGL